MHRTRSLCLTALAGIAVLSAAPGNARPARDTRPLPARQNDRASDEGFREADIALRTQSLDRKQREKIHDLVEKYRRRIADIRRDRNMAPSKREDNIWKARRDLRKDVLKVLNKEQRARVEAIAARDGRYGPGDRYDREVRYGRPGAYRAGR